MNNTELIKAGHELAKAINYDTPLIEIAKMVSSLATRLDCTTSAQRETAKQRDALAAENAGLKAWAEDRAVIDDALEQKNYTSLKIDWRQNSLRNIKTPATDAYLAEVRAQGVEMFAGEIGDYAKGKSQATAEIIKATGRNALMFAAQLRQEAAQ